MSLVPSASPAARPATSSGPRAVAWRAFSRIATELTQQRDRDHVVVGVARLAREEQVGRHQRRDRGHRGRAGAVRAPAAPGREQRQPQPGQVQQRREEVVAEEHQAVRVQQLGDLGVEPVEVERVGEEQLGDRPGLRDVRREGHVVPERVAAVDTPVQRQQSRARPLHRHQQRDRDGDPELGVRDRGRLALALGTLALARVLDDQRLQAQGAAADDHAGGRQQHPVEDSHQAEQLGDHDQGRNREQAAREQRRRSAPPRQEGAAQGATRDRHRDPDRHQRRHAQQVLAGAAHLEAPGAGRRLQSPVSSSPSIRKTETRPSCRTSSAPVTPISQPRSGEVFAVAGSLRSSSGVVTT